MLRMDIFADMPRDHEGAVLQASCNNKDWTTIGQTDEGINWYNSDRIAPLSPGNGTGWTGDTLRSTEWVEARHDLDLVADSSRVRLRIVFSADQATPGGGGFAFDNVRIGPRTRIALLEHFTNGSDDSCKAVDAYVNTVLKNNYKDMVKLEYHTDFPGFDPFNQQNPAPPATRSLYYGITSVPYSVLEGGGNALQFDYQTSSLSGKAVDRIALTDPKFRIILTSHDDGGMMTVNVTLIALENLVADERILQVAVYEKLISDVPTQNGESRFQNVIRDLLPNAAGTAIFDSWMKGETRNYSFTWNEQNVYDPEMVRVAAFIQNDNTREIYQVASNETGGPATGDAGPFTRLPGVAMYPNPASDILNISLSQEYATGLRIEFYDQLGRMVRNMPWHQAGPVTTADVSDLKPGLYYVRLVDRKGKVRAYHKVVIMR